MTPYKDIPVLVRDVLDQSYTRRGVSIWWNAPNKMLGGFRPSDVWATGATLAVLDLAQSLADGNFA